MLRRMNALVKCSIRASDGDIGGVTDAYVDDEQWVVRYLVVDTGMWLGWHVLIAPQSITALDWERHQIVVDLTRDQVEQSPRADLQHPLSRLYETEFYTHFGYPPYWDAPPAWTTTPVTPELAPEAMVAAAQAQAAAIEHAEGVGPASGAADELPSSSDPRVASAADSHLRSWRDVKGYHIHATDGEIGHVDDLLVDDKTWIVHLIEVDTSNWIGGKSVLVPRRALGTVSWPDSLLNVRLTREQVKHSPRSDEAHLNGALERELDEFYGGKTRS